ncbi:EAL domain-containing protein [Altererythrobacter indicus]|uniref:EAL domain-containing protein n=1 Tax=Altericroceibacterium indicum TaxID=374177 RepID=A0A845A702_9SPHN|nr:bifunctional diguanylate cyclase/phosphodiesterase [Altericroceibacterium indicum]MXP25444.1 EAL domain-containing protein [Altericroceibacterium indicum]
MLSPIMYDDELQRDLLTGLVSGFSAMEAIDSWRGEAGERPFVHATLIGLNRFDTVNLAYGEEAGDSALVEVAARIQRFAEGDAVGPVLVSRIKGGSFLLASSKPCSRERWQWLAEELLERIAVPIRNPEAGIVRLSPRAVLYGGVIDSAGEMFAHLEDAQRSLQVQSGARLLWADRNIMLAGRPTQLLEADLLTALDRDEIQIFYQPQFSAADGKLLGAEALARWQHPELGRIGATALFAIAERADHVSQLSRHIVRKAIAGAVPWPKSLRLSLNVTPADLASGNFAEEFIATVNDAGFPIERLTLEITEHTLVTELDRSAMQLAQLAALGMRIALDDFGAGFCNFRYLKQLPLHYLKLDRSMVEGITHDARDLAVFRGIIAMAQALDLLVIAEGIETAEQLSVIAEEGCESYQGFLSARPMTGEDFQRLVAKTSL